MTTTRKININNKIIIVTKINWFYNYIKVTFVKQLILFILASDGDGDGGGDVRGEEPF